jgi:hypothetical protein
MKGSFSFFVSLVGFSRVEAVLGPQKNEKDTIGEGWGMEEEEGEEGG